jgi:hypothetical protein
MTMGLSWYQLRNYAALLVLSMTALLLSAAVHADASVTVETQVYELDDDTPAPAIPSSKYFAAAHFGPFIMVAANRAELNGTIETNTPVQFRAMLRSFPALKQIDMIDCPGTDDDEANFIIARLIRKAGITTNVPDGGSVRSGGVELFLAGARRHAAPTAEFAVHSWRDEDGLEAEDYAANNPANQEYINFYREIGMDAAKAKAFYALTNSVSNDEALYLKPRDIAAYIPLD